MADVAAVLRERLGAAAAKVPKRRCPICWCGRWRVRPRRSARSSASWEQELHYSSEKAQSMLGWSPRPVEETIVDCAQSMIDQGVVGASSQDSAG